MISMFTDLPVRAHGWNLPSGAPKKMPRVPDTPLLGEVLQEAGLKTTALVANFYLNQKIEFDRGFDVWRPVYDRTVVAACAEEVAGWSPEERHFLYVHLMGSHSPLDPGEDAAARWETKSHRAQWRRSKLHYRRAEPVDVMKVLRASTSGPGT